MSKHQTLRPPQSWLHITPASGTGPATLRVTVHPASGIPEQGAVTGDIAFTAVGSASGLGPIQVTLNLKVNADAPIGTIDTPTDNRTGVTGAVPFTGWALDDIGIGRVMICRAAVAGEAAPVEPRCGGVAEIFVGFGVTIDGARPDVAAAFLGYPTNTAAGWGLMVLTTMLPNGGNGAYLFHAYAQDREGHLTSVIDRGGAILGRSWKGDGAEVLLFEHKTKTETCARRAAGRRGPRDRA
jgi:hypothetical protein